MVNIHYDSAVYEVTVQEVNFASYYNINTRAPNTYDTAIEKEENRRIERGQKIKAES